MRNQALAQGAFFAVLMAGIGIVGLAIPPLFFLANLLIPLLLAVLLKRQDLKTGLMALVLFIILLLFFPGPRLVVCILVLQTAPLGLVLGLLFKNHASAGVSFVLSAITLSFFTLFGLFLSVWVTGNNPLTGDEEINRVLEEVMEWSTRAGLTDSLSREELEEITTRTLQTTSQLFPANLVIWSTITAGLTYFLIRQVLGKLSYSLPQLSPFTQWRFPWFLSWGLIAGLGLTLVGDSGEIFAVSVLGKNILFISGFLYFVAGLAVAGFYLARWGAPWWLKFILIGFAVFYFPLAAIVLVVLGIADSFRNFRQKT